MKFEIINENAGKDSAVYLTFKGELTIYTVKTIKETISSHSISNNELSLDLTGLSKMDSAGYQLLLYFCRELSLYGKKFLILGNSSESERLFSLYGSPV
jgi:anti-anti-sigma factor